MEKDDLAEPLLRHGLAICEHTFGEEHIDTARSLKALIDLLMKQPRYEEVELCIDVIWISFSRRLVQKILTLLLH